jgi:HEAT repeat protein
MNINNYSIIPVGYHALTLFQQRIPGFFRWYLSKFAHLFSFLTARSDNFRILEFSNTSTRMAFNISRALNIERKERGIVLLLLTQSVFLGIFAGSLDVGANSLFLESYGAALMPRAFMFSGIVGIVFTSIYAYLQKRIPFKLFTLLNLLIVVALTGILRIGYALNSEDERLAFALLVMMGPLIIISLLGFWGTAGRYFTLREGKRLFGIIDTGAVVGMILAFYAVPVLVRFDFRVYDTLMIGLGGLIVAFLFQVITIQRYRFIPVVVRQPGAEKKRSGFMQVFRTRYTRLMVFFVALSVITGFFIHYLFVSVTEFRYPDAKELTGFLGAFFGTMMVFTVIIKSTLYGWMMKNYGLRVAILVGPIMLILLIGVAAVVGGVFGYTAEAASFTFFFLVIALSKLFNKSLKDAIESPSMKILYQSLDSSERYDIQARIDGTVNELTAFITGLIMAGLILLNFIHIIHFAYILLFIMVLWMFMGGWLYTAYRKRLNDSLSTARLRSAESSSNIVRKALSGECMYCDIARLDPLLLHYMDDAERIGLLTSGDARRQRIGWELAGRTVIRLSKQQVEEIKRITVDKENRDRVVQYERWQAIRSKTIDDAFRSPEHDERIAALYATWKNSDSHQVPHIITLLRDRDLQIRSIAIEVAGHLRVRELCSYLVDYLDDDALYEVTLRALTTMGEMALESLENAFQKAGISVEMQVRIVEAMVIIGGPAANELLFSKVGYHQREIRSRIIEGLYEAGFRANEKQRAILMDLAYETVYAGAWSLAATYVVEQNDPGNGLLDALKEEKQDADTLLFKILAISYDKYVIDHIRDSIQDVENTESGFALELLNLVIDEEQFAYLEPYFEDISVADKIRRLQIEMPLQILDYTDLLKELVNRDALYSGSFTRVCALDAIGRTEEIEATQQLAAQVFHPNEVVRDTAAAVLSMKKPAVFDEISKRLEHASEERLDRSFLAAYVEHHRHLETIATLASWPLFSSISHEELFDLTRHLHEATPELVKAPDRVLLLRAERSDEWAAFSNGWVVIPACYPEMERQLADLVSAPGTEAYAMDATALRKLLFSKRSLKQAIEASLYSSEIGTLTKELTNPDT